MSCINAQVSFLYSSSFRRAAFSSPPHFVISQPSEGELSSVARSRIHGEPELSAEPDTTSALIDGVILSPYEPVTLTLYPLSLAFTPSLPPSLPLSVPPSLSLPYALSLAASGERCTEGSAFHPSSQQRLSSA